MQLTNSWIEKARAFGQLFQGWNGADAPVPTLPAIANAIRFISTLTEAGYPPTRVAPSAMGGVAVTRRVGDRKVLVEFLNDGSAGALCADDATRQMQTRRVPTTPEGFGDLLETVREYMDDEQSLQPLR